MDRDGAVGVATRYRLDGLWTESRWGGRGASLAAPIATGPGTETVSCKKVTESFREVRGRDVVLTTHFLSNAEV